MDLSARATGFDLFKSIVAILLLILFFLLNWRTTAQSPALISTGHPNPSAAPTTAPTLLVNVNPTDIPASPNSISLTSTPLPLPSPTATNDSVPTITPLPAPTATEVAQLTATPLPSQIESATSSPSTPIAGTPAGTACDAASSRSHLQTGMSATILRRLNFRSSPGVGNNWLLTNLPGTRVEVVGGPECIPHSRGAYVWWQIKLPDGQVGWSAEASQHGAFYFMEPIR